MMKQADLRWMRRDLLLAATLCVAGAANALWAHPFHVSLAEVEWNAQSGNLEVAVRVDPFDLERVLQQRVGRPLRLEKETEAQLDVLLREWVADVFRVEGRVAAGGRRRVATKLEWVGHEQTPRFVWLYFELAFPCDVQALEVTQAMFLEEVPKQVNTVTLRVGRWTGAVNCTAQRPTQSVAVPRVLRRPK